jgi:hypothetical protein
MSDTSQLLNSPFIVGLTAHADLEPTQVPQLVEAVVRFLLEIKQHLVNTHVRVLLDPCNDAGLAIARATLGLGISVDALVTTPALDPGRSCATGSIEDLLSQPRVHRIEVAAASSGARPGKLSSTTADILIRRSSLLLALWDGNSSSLPYDTADQVFRFLGVRGEQSEKPNSIEVTTAESELDVTAQMVFWVPARRCDTDADEVEPQSYYLLAAGENVLDVQQSMPSSLRQRLADLNEYNSDFQRFAADASLVRSESLMHHMSAETASGDSAVLENIDGQFVKADSLACYMQRHSDRLFNLFGITTFTMGVAYLAYDKIAEAKVLLLLYTLVLLISLLAYYLLRTKHWLSKYLSYRALAETLRVRFFLAFAGVDRRMHTRELIALTGIARFPRFSWISFVLDSIEPTAPEASHSSETYSLRARIVDQVWIDDQYRYFARKVETMQKSHQWIGRLKRGVFIVVLMVLSVMFFFGKALDHADAFTGLPVKNVLTFCTGFLAIVLGVWELRQNKMAVRELLWQYRSQLSQFQRARIELQRITSRARRDDLLRELGERSLMEIYLWAIHRYHREHAPPAAP